MSMKTFRINEKITQRDSRSLKSYYQELKQIPVLTHDEEYELSYAAFNGDEIARQKLIKHNLRFVISVAKQYAMGDIKLEDLINEGNIGLVMASSKFDPSRGFKFLSYAVWWIRRQILGYITDNGKTIRLPNNKVNLINKIKSEYNFLEQKLQRQPSYVEMVDKLGEDFTKDDIEFYIETMENNNITSLDAEIGGDEGTTALINLISDSSGISASYYVDEDDAIYRRNAILNLLDKEVEREVINLLYGLDGKTPLPLKTIGFLLGLSSERIRQIRDMALEQLKVKITF